MAARRTPFGALIIAALLFLLSGCYTTPEAGVVEVPDIPLPGSYQSMLYGYKLSYPEGWSVIHSGSAKDILDEAAAGIEGKKKNDLIKAAKEQGFVFLVDDSASDYGVTLAITGGKSKSSPGKYLSKEDQVRKAYADSFPGISYTEPFRCIDLGRGGDTILVAFTYDLDGQSQAIRQYAVFAGGKLYSLTLTCPGAEAETYADIGDAIVASFAVTN